MVFIKFLLLILFNLNIYENEYQHNTNNPLKYLLPEMFILFYINEKLYN